MKRSNAPTTSNNASLLESAGNDNGSGARGGGYGTNNNEENQNIIEVDRGFGHGHLRDIISHDATAGTASVEFSGYGKKSSIHHGPPTRESLTNFNNQTTILMATATFANDNQTYIMMMHETRIFYFKAAKGVALGEQWQQYCTDLTNVFLHLTTSTKYRLLNAFYLFWRTIDTAILLALILVLLLEHEDLTFEKIFHDNIGVFIVVFIEVFYDIMEYNVKIWMLNRISLYFGIILFILYYLVFDYYNLFDYTSVIVLFIARCVAFILEMLVDFCMDLEIAHDLTENAITPMKFLGALYWTSSPNGNIIDDHQHLRHLELPCEYVDSICAWSSMNAFNIDMASRNRKNNGSLNHNDNIDQLRANEHNHFAPHRLFLYFMLFFSCLVGSPIIICIVLIAMFFGIVRILMCCKGESMWHELIHEHSV